jgi:hypothetical protein
VRTGPGSGVPAVVRRSAVIPLELRTEIRRLYYAEHWKVGTIASSLHVHHETVQTAIASETLGVRRGVCRASALDPYLPVVRDTLAQFPRLRATRLHEMLRVRGYPGSVVQVRRAVRQLRPSPVGLYRRLETLAGEEAQVDWGTFGTIRIGHGTRAVSGFAPCTPSSPSTNRSRASCAATSRPSTPWADRRAPSCTTI